MMKSLILLGVVLNFSFIACKSCNDFKNCGDCISYTKERCIWCAQESMNKENPVRCQSQSEENNEKWCPLLQIHNPNSTKQVMKNKDFSSENGKEVQLRPQKMTVTLRPGVPVPFIMSYQPADDYPLDLYFLMDNSFTMKKHAEDLANQTINIYEALKKMTKNVRIGLGTFVEKPEMPFTDPRIKYSYAFKHHLSLTDNMTRFKQEVDNYPLTIGSNYDSQEAGLDALMQVMTCENKIGWRNKSPSGPQSRRIILLATDGPYHSAGDGKMVGAYIPNNMTCLLDASNMYNKQASMIMDYPSVSQINYMAQKKDMMIVFTVLGGVINVYEALTEGIQKAQAVVLRENDIVKIVEDSYMKASREVLIIPSRVPATINVTTSCGKCLSTQENPEVIITATVTALECPNSKAVQTFDLEVSGLVDKLTVEVNVDCECECEKDIPATKSAECNRVGFKLCGACKCDKDRSGDTCNIECKDALENMEQCKDISSPNTYCNGQGTCVCGKCICNSDFSGDFCQHNDAECRKLCPADRGDCNLGECVCKDYSQWTGPHCDCPLSNETCISPFSKQPCSGKGRCECGKCKCDSKEIKDYGVLAFCTDSAKDLCEQLKNYAFCSYEMKPKAECDLSYPETSVDKVTIMNKTELEAETSATACRKKLDDGNILVYKFVITTNPTTEKPELELMIQKELESPPVVNLWITIGSVIGGVLLVGLLTLIIWKIVTGIYDKREYEKFCKEATDQGFDVVNPVYLDPTVIFTNPTFEAQKT